MSKCCSLGDGRKAVSRGLCATHYKQTRRGKSLTPIGSAIANRGFASMTPERLFAVASRGGRAAHTPAHVRTGERPGEDMMSV